MRARRCDFHTHTVFSDGLLLPMELIRRAAVADHRAIAITDHASFSNIDWVVRDVAKDCARAEAWDIDAIPGVEITHVPVKYIDEAVKLARDSGAEIVVVHGETPVEPVEQGTNHAAVSNPDVDILAHPGIISEEDARKAAANGVFLELSCRRGHSTANGHVASVARVAGAQILVNTDAHAPEDLSSMATATSIAKGAGLDADSIRQALVTNPESLLRKLGRLRDAD
ncbi:MAG TPA: histidinol phosphate phosphatase domain-containing protein [Thermoplasmata archaeon]|nr:histidinol phosphate phosphatase domain-containing protein [Thermoplasmata archaeon]